MVETDINAAQQHGAAASLADKYLDGAIRLRQAATWNNFDANPNLELPQRIIPVVDADVIRLFMAPAEETAYVNPFPGLESRSASRREWNDPLTLVATATAEFIFLTEGLEVLGKSVTKWNEPLRIASPHLQDVEAMLYQIKAKIVKGLTSLEELEDDVIERLDPLLERSRHSADGGLTKLVNALPNSLRELYLGPLYEAQRWIRLRGEDKVLLRLDGLKEATRDILEPDDDVIERWREPLYNSLLRTHGSVRYQGRHQDRQDLARRARKRAERDAQVLASVTALNEAGLRLGPAHGWRAILISGDEHMHRIYARWAWETSGASLRPERYVLRRPLQYTPVLNIAAMSNDPSAAEIFTRLTTALDVSVDLLLEQKRDRLRSPYLLEHHWEQHRKVWLGNLDQRGIDEHLTRCNGHWLEAINHINARNHSYLTRDYQRLFDRLREAFDEPDARSELMKHTKSVVDDINAEHFWLVIDETICDLAATANPMRMPFLVRTEFPEFLSGVGGSIARFLYGQSESLMMQAHEQPELDELAGRIREASSIHATFLIAILAAASGAFVRAGRLMTRAQQLPPAPADAGLASEMTYFHALIRRLNIKDEDDYRRARELLQRELLLARGDKFRLARARSEAAALELHWYANDSDRPVTLEQRKPHLDQGAAYLVEARNSLDWSTDPQSDRLWRELALQIVVNTIALNAYIKFVGGNPDLGTVRWAREQFDALLNGVDAHKDYVTELWWLAAAWLVDGSAETASAVAEHCRKTLAGSHRNEIPAADANDLKRIQAYFKNNPI